MLKLKITLAVAIVAAAIWPVAAQTVTETPLELQTRLQSVAQGDVVSMDGMHPESCRRISMSRAFTGGKLIFSDSPESPANAGILYMDTNLAATDASLPNRIFVYHVNASLSGKMKFCVLIKNNGRSAATLTVRRTGIAGPGVNYLRIGETALYRWLTNNTAITRTVAPGQTIRLDPHFDSIGVSRGDLLNGIWDYTFNRPHAIIVCALRIKDAPLSAGPALKVLARDVHDRGTFEHCNKTCSIIAGAAVDTAWGVAQFAIGGNDDIYVSGWDNSVYPPVAMINDGNYGVLYTVKLKATSADARALALLISPQGGRWCGAVNADPGLLPGGVFFIPSNGRNIGDPSSAVVGGEYLPGPKKSVRFQFQFMPAGASSFPVCIMTVPFSTDH